MRAEKDIARYIDESSMVWTFIDDGKLANQTARIDCGKTPLIPLPRLLAESLLLDSLLSYSLISQSHSKFSLNQPITFKVVVMYVRARFLLYF